MLILLIGPKGSGKSHIGRLLASELGVYFFHVEPHWMAYHAACAQTGQPVDLNEGMRRIHPRIAAALETHRHVCVETTGASVAILDDLLLLGQRFRLLLVQVTAPLSLCLQRITDRDPTHQIPVPEAQIREVYARSAAVDVPYDIVLRNRNLTDEAILQPFLDAGVGNLAA